MKLFIYTSAVPAYYDDNPHDFDELLASIDTHVLHKAAYPDMLELRGMETCINIGDKLPDLHGLTTRIIRLLSSAEPRQDLTAIMTPDIFWSLLNFYKEVYPYDFEASGYVEGVFGIAPTPRAFAMALVPGIGHYVRIEPIYYNKRRGPYRLH